MRLTCKFFAADFDGELHVAMIAGALIQVVHTVTASGRCRYITHRRTLTTFHSDHKQFFSVRL